MLWCGPRSVTARAVRRPFVAPRLGSHAVARCSVAWAVDPGGMVGSCKTSGVNRCTQQVRELRYSSRPCRSFGLSPCGLCGCRGSGATGFGLSGHHRADHDAVQFGDQRCRASDSWRPAATPPPPPEEGPGFGAEPHCSQAAPRSDRCGRIWLPVENVGEVMRGDGHARVQVETMSVRPGRPDA